MFTSIDYIVKNYSDKISKTDILALILSVLMKTVEINTDEYFIMAGYGLRGLKEIGDLDVGVNRKSFQILKQYLPSSTAKISKTERIVLKLNKLKTEIEFFELENKGFPSNKYSLKNLLKNKNLITDPFGNYYFNARTLADFYSEVKLIDGVYYVGDYEVSKDRIVKNINQLTLLYNGSKKHREYIKSKIAKIKKMLV